MNNLMSLHLRSTLLALTGALLMAGCVTVPVPAGTGTLSVTTSPIDVPAVPTAEQEALKARVALQDRLYRVAAPLLVKNPDLCKGNARKLLGFTAKNKYSFTSEFVDAAERSFNLDERLRVMSVLAGSGATNAGVRHGDVLLSVEDKPIPQGPNAERLAAAILGPLVNGRDRVRLSLQRNGTNLNPTVPLTLACAFGIELGNADNVNAYSDGHRVMVTRGMMNVARSDAELAAVIAREMAHSALGHAGRMRMSATLGAIIDNLIRIHPDLTTMGGMAGVKPFAQDVDAAADTLSLYMLARAGYDVDAARNFWQRLATQYPATVVTSYTAIHPATAFRLGVMDQIVPQVKAKLANNQQLSP
ncbi:MAG: M48 family metalloprotease [Herminiimonas sp.]|nr:M48 family metalloprotease [Herminiimonas sp.]